MTRVVFRNKNKQVVATGETKVSPGQIYYKGVPLETVVERLSYVPFFIHFLLGKNGTSDHIDRLENVLTQNVDRLIPPSDLERIAHVRSTSYHQMSEFANLIGAQYETGTREKRYKALKVLHRTLGLFDEIDPHIASAFLFLNVLPKLYAIIDKREPYHNANTFIESFFVNVLGRDRHELDQRELIVWDAYLVSLCTHGLTSPSYHGFRVAANAQAPFTTALGTWLAIASADLHFGALSGSMHDLYEVAKRGITHGEHIEEILKRGERVKGYGHRVHPRLLANYPHSTGTLLDHQEIEYCEDLQTDPRVRINFALWDKLGYSGTYTTMARERAKHAFTLVGCANVDTMGAGLYGDLGLDDRHMLIGPTIARIPHLTEVFIAETMRVRPNTYIDLQERS